MKKRSTLDFEGDVAHLIWHGVIVLVHQFPQVREAYALDSMRLEKDIYRELKAFLEKSILLRNLFERAALDNYFPDPFLYGKRQPDRKYADEDKAIVAVILREIFRSLNRYVRLSNGYIPTNKSFKILIFKTVTRCLDRERDYES